MKDFNDAKIERAKLERMKKENSNIAVDQEDKHLMYH